MSSALVVLTEAGFTQSGSGGWRFEAGVFYASVACHSGQFREGVYLGWTEMSLRTGRRSAVTYRINPDEYWPPSTQADAELRVDRDARAAVSGLAAGDVRARVRDRKFELLVPRADDWVLTGPTRYMQGNLSELGDLEGFVDVRSLGESIEE